MKNAELARLLASRFGSDRDTHDDVRMQLTKACGDVGTPALGIVFALFLDTPDTSDMASQTVAQQLASDASLLFDVHSILPPKLAHVELLVPPLPDSDGGRIHFATYMSSAGAEWQNRTDKSDGIRFYLQESGSRWRAVPLVMRDAPIAVRRCADANVGAPYSLAMYLTSAPPGRLLSKLWSNKQGTRGHCAVITSRVLRTSGLTPKLKHTDAWYSPTSLYNELHTSYLACATSELCESLRSIDPCECTTTINMLLHQQLDANDVARAGDAKCYDAISQLSHEVYIAARSADAEAIVLSQKRLATGLLKWVLLRQDVVRL